MDAGTTFSELKGKLEENVVIQKDAINGARKEKNVLRKMERKRPLNVRFRKRWVKILQYTTRKVSLKNLTPIGPI